MDERRGCRRPNTCNALVTFSGVENRMCKRRERECPVNYEQVCGGYQQEGVRRVYGKTQAVTGGTPADAVKNNSAGADNSAAG